MKLSDCIQPWHELQFDYHDQMRPCCYYSDELPKLNYNINETWNGSHFQNIRKIIKENQNFKNGCSNCDYLKITGKLWKQKYDDEIPKNLNENDEISKKRLKNFLLSKKEFLEKKIILNCLPTKIYVNFGVKCNFKCTFCFQNIEREQNDTRTVLAEKLFFNKEKIKIAQEIQLIGGEPLLIKESIKFLEMLKSDEDFKNINLRLTTNGSLLHRYLEKLSFFNYLNIELSLEAIGSDLESSRVGAKWDKIKNNIINFKKYAKENNKNWKIHIPCAVMFTTLKNNNLYKLTNWCLENDVNIKYYKVSGITNYDFENEDFFQNPKLLKKLQPNTYENIFNETIDLLEKNQKTFEKNNLEMIFSIAKNSTYKLKKSYIIKKFLHTNTKNIYKKIFPENTRYKIGKIRRKIFNIKY